jgi:predicted RNA-binding Zn-ribbon protein involved in translation (DUF1610 family)
MHAKKKYATFICPACGYTFHIRSVGKNPHIEKINSWLVRAQCPDCGAIVRGHSKEKIKV